jgi:hypothetical protein
MRPLLYWLYLNLKYRIWSLPTDPVLLQKIATSLKVPLAFTYRAHGLDVTLVQQRIHENLKSFPWTAPLALIALSFALIMGAIISQCLLTEELMPSTPRKNGKTVMYP